MPDYNSEASNVWDALKPAIDGEIDQRTRGMVQRRKAKVTTAPSLVTNKIGVTEPYGTEIFIPFVSNLASAVVGDYVWVEFMYGANNSFASMFASADSKDQTVAGNLTVGGVLDVTQRRCYAASLDAGWYRVLTFAATSAAYARGATGNEVVFHITRRRTTAGEETHEIKMLCQYDNISFVDEVSKSLPSYQRITKIRYTYDGTNGYVDICVVNVSAHVTVDFEVYCEPAYQALYTSGGLQSVAESPYGETELTRYTFSANGTGALIVNGDLSAMAVLDVIKRRCYAGLSQVGWYRVMTIPNGFGTAADSFAIDINITRTYNNTTNEVHSVKALFTYGSYTSAGLSFVNEASKTNFNGLLVDKIRYTFDSNRNAHLDIHYTGSVNNNTAVDFAVHVDPRFQYLFTAVNMTFMGTADPANETVLREYTFAANTEYTRYIWTPTFSGTVNPSCNNVDCYYSVKNGILYAGGRFNIVSFTSGSTWLYFSLPVSLGANRGAETIGTLFITAKTLMLRWDGNAVLVTNAGGNYSGALLENGFWAFQIVAPINP